MRILGIDPGSRTTGYGVIEMSGNKALHIASGALHLGAEALPQRLDEIFSAITQVAAEYQPETMAIERVFMHRNADSALKLGQARGAAICAATSSGLPVNEYSPREIKQAVVGKGSAAKEQVQHMVRALLGLRETPQSDAADALAVALCHGHVAQTRLRTGIPVEANSRIPN